jgi:cyclic beta-1,2-glucan synthetase
MRHVGITSQQAAAFQHLGRYLIYPDMHLRADAATVEAGLAPQSALWPLAISGDFPIFALRINDDMDMDVAREALSAQEYLRSRGVKADLVIINERAESYAQDLQHGIDAICENLRRRGQAEGSRQDVFSVRRDLIDDIAFEALLATARVVFHARNGQIVDQVNRAVSLFAPAKGSEADGNKKIAALPVVDFPVDRPVADAGDLDFWNGYGGFAKDGDEYVVRLHGGQSTPQPWINVISNEHFGFHISAEGAGFTWSRNSRDYQLTPWTNDPVINRPGEAFYVADVKNGTVYTPLAALSRRSTAVFETRHGLGYSVFSTEEDGLALELTQTVDKKRPVKTSRLLIRNTGSEARKLRVYGYAEWVLGNNAQKSAPFILTSQDATTGAMFATNPYSVDYNGRIAFLAASETPSSVTGSRREFIGRHGSVQLPQAVGSAAVLSGSTELDGDPCAALAIDLTLTPGEEREVLFFMGDSDTPDAARDLIGTVRAEAFGDTLKASRDFWQGVTGHLKISTPDKALDNMVNHWLPYQALGCRILARSAFYQASGAFGFRDQLQDTLAFLLYQPALARKQILNAAGRQFREGDVQHWWLPETGAGVRTLISDDVVWMGHAAHQYVTVTGDLAVLDEQIPFLEGAILADGQHDSFFRPETSSDTASLYEHAALALDLAITRTGPHGLPLILGGDWNDGMNRVGIKGQGESVWLGWFLAGTLRDFLVYAQARKDKARVERWTKHLEALKAALATSGWDGSYYRRGYFDNGTPLGSHESDECQIDSLGQSWSVLSGEGDPERSTQAMNAVMEQLVDADGGIIRLFTPAFAETEQDPGYIKAYPPGVRENGGQYTHAATWVVLALAEMGRGDDAYRCLSLLNPVNHALDRAASDKYRVEPYVVAADVYGNAHDLGRGGWTWYTGSAGWLYRAAIEGILGIRRVGDRLHVRPALPSGWEGFEAQVSIDGTAYKIAVTKPAGGTAHSVSVNGTVLAGDEGFALTKA